MPDRPVKSVIANKHFVTAPKEMPVKQAAVLLKKYHEGAVLVVDQGRLVGICTERDIAFDIVAEGLDAALTPLSAIMTPNPQAISPEKPFAHALHLMFEGGFRHVPVVGEDGVPLGVVSARDALGLDVLQFEKDLILREGLAEVL